MLKRWEDLPKELQNEKVREYYILLKKKKGSLLIKRVFDLIVSSVLLVLCSPIFLVLAIAIKADSKGPVFFRQVRVTQYGREFQIFKFRTMVQNAEKIGTQVTIHQDARVTRVGKLLRGCRLDELGQLIDVFRGTMSFVGTRPEVPRYVEAYTEEMMATLLLPAGVTSTASICYKDENRLLNNAQNVDKVYTENVLPQKMSYNLMDIKEFGLMRELQILVKTVLAVCGVEIKGKEGAGK